MKILHGRNKHCGQRIVPQNMDHEPWAVIRREPGHARAGSDGQPHSRHKVLA
jgi:hypothetical protein